MTVPADTDSPPGDAPDPGPVPQLEIPYRYEPSASAAGLHRDHDGLEAGQETDIEVTVAGRVMFRRDQGKVAFATLTDPTGSVQLFARKNTTAGFDDFVRTSLGDWVGARGRVMKTRMGELSVEVTDWVLLAEARRSFGDKWNGVSDVETRFRQREVDLWANEGTRATLLLRSRAVSFLRRRLEDRGFVEVETPLLHPIPGGALAKPFVTHHNALDVDLYLRIAPELYLKRLVIGGFEKVFEIGRVFRNEGISPRHNPEFTMLELYQAYADHTDIMALVEDLVSSLALHLLGTTTLTYQGRDLDLSPPWERRTMASLVSGALGTDLDVHTPPAVLAGHYRDVTGEDAPEAWGTGKLLQELYEKTAESGLWGPVFVVGFPAEVSPLARRDRGDPDLAERFEAIVAGRELCNAFSELVDPDDQRSRFLAQAAAHAAGDEEAMVLDEDYLRAMEHGLPPTGGLGIGIDRLVMLLADVANIREVIAFPTLRPER